MSLEPAYPASQINAESAQSPLDLEQISLPNPFFLEKDFKRLFGGLKKLGRFRTLRRTYSVLRELKQRLEPVPKFDPKLLQPGPDSLIHSRYTTTEMIESTQDKAVALGMSLNSETIKNIYRFAENSLCTEPGYENKTESGCKNKTFRIGDLDFEGKLPDGHDALRALVENPEQCPEIKKIAEDKWLLNLVAGYLGYYPDIISLHLTWSVASGKSEQYIQDNYPPAKFHYDIAGFNFATTYFYITPVIDETGGPHEMFLGSHNRKKLPMLLRSGRQPVEELRQFYGEDVEYMVLGDSGFGFFQDPSCFHRVRSPQQYPRLILILRYA